MRTLWAAALLSLFVGGTQIVDVLKEPTKFNKKTVTIEGKAAVFEQRTSKIGNKYVTFQITQGDQTLSVYAQGEVKPELKDDEKVTIKGRFFMENKVGTNTFKNEIVLNLKDKDALKREE
ncbi:hypothetical protein BH11ARM2_BH11ARM2_34660 [soil metagenome]